MAANQLFPDISFLHFSFKHFIRDYISEQEDPHKYSYDTDQDRIPQTSDQTDEIKCHDQSGGGKSVCLLSNLLISLVGIAEQHFFQLFGFFNMS